MTEEQLETLCRKVGDTLIELYANLCEKIPKSIVITGMTGAFAACVKEAGYDRDSIIAALNSAFDDIEGIENEDSDGKR